MTEIVKHGKYWKQFTCPECGKTCHPDEEDKENE